MFLCNGRFQQNKTKWTSFKISVCLHETKHNFACGVGVNAVGCLKQNAPMACNCFSIQVLYMYKLTSVMVAALDAC